MKYFILFLFIVAVYVAINIFTGSENNTTITKSYTPDTQYSVKMLGDMIGADVNNYNGDNLGFVQDIAIDTKTKEINYAVLSYTRGSKLFAVPLSALEHDSQNNSLILDMNYIILDQMEGFDENSWPDYADPRLALGTKNYFKSEKSWAHTFSSWENIISQSYYDYRLTKLSDLLNYKLESENGEIIGYVNDLVLSSNNHIEYVAVFFWDSSFSDMPFRFEFIPFKDLIPDTDKTFKVKSGYFRELYTDNYSEYKNPYSVI